MDSLVLFKKEDTNYIVIFYKYIESYKLLSVNTVRKSRVRFYLTTYVKPKLTYQMIV